MSETTAAQFSSQPGRPDNGPPSATLLEHIRKLQSDGLLLLDHLTKRPSRHFLAGAAPKETDGKAQAGANGKDKSPKESGETSPTSDLDLSFEPLRRNPEAIANDPELFPALVCVVDELARLAYPATPDSIERSRRKITASGFLLFCFLILGLASALLMSSKIIEGRNLVADSRAVLTQAQESHRTLSRLNPENFVTMECVKVPASDCEPKLATPAPSAELVNAYPYCEPDSPLGSAEDRKTRFYLQPKSTDAKQLCSQLGEQKLRERMIFARLQGWNCEMAKAPFLADAFLRLGLELRTVVRGEFHNKLHYTECTDWFMSNEDLLRHWQRSELRAIPTLQLLSQHLLPGAMAMLGAAIAMLMNQNRARLDGRLRDNFLSTLAMVIMPTSLGALIGLVWGTNPDIITANQIKFGDFSLSLAVVAFFVGFVFEDVLNWLRRALLSTLENNASTKIVVKS
jgi:hypothetical protein